LRLSIYIVSNIQISHSGSIKYSQQDSKDSNSWRCWLLSRHRSLDIELKKFVL